MSTLEFITFSKLINNIDAGDTSKKRSNYNYIDLEKLVNAFKLDFEYETPDYIPYGNRPGFISKSFYQTNPDLGYNYPPKGPIDKYFKCTYCKKIGPDFHGITCKRPFESSLVLTEEGAERYPGINKGTNYLIIIKKTGQKKIITSSLKSEKFSDSVELIYETRDFKKIRVLVSRNGVVNIISGSSDINTLENSLVKKINETNALTENYPHPSFLIDPTLSYTYLIFAQFYLLDKEKNKLNLRSVDNYLQEYINSNYISYAGNSFVIDNYDFNSGSRISRNNVLTNPFIKFDLLLDTTKINVMILNKGTVQIRGSNATPKTRRNVEKAKIVQVYNFLKELLGQIMEDAKDSGLPIMTDVIPKAEKIKQNTVDNKEPQKCQNRGGRDVRPVPYSFYGKCPMPGYYNSPRGIRRDDGLYEPCCYKINTSGQDRKARILNIIENGYPDPEAAIYNEEPDALTSVYKPGTKIREIRARQGLKDLSRNELLKCIEDAGYIEEATLFTEKDEDYTEFKEQVFKMYSSLTGSNVILKQIPSVLTNENFDNFTKYRYLVCPIFPGTIYSLLYFNEHGESYFLNLNNDVSDSGLPAIIELKNTIIAGYLLPFKEPDFIFYVVDLLFYNGKNTMVNKFLDSTNGNRYKGLMYSFRIIENYNQGPLKVEKHFDQNIIKGSNYFSNNNNLLFISYDSPFTQGKLNKQTMLWNDSLHVDNLYISLNVVKESKNRWKVTVDNKTIPEDLLSSTIEISIKFTDDNKIKDNDCILFKIMINQVTKKIAGQKPLLPVEKIEQSINDYSDVINILQSIQNPIKKETFKPNEFKLGNTVYTSVSVDRPLIKS